MTELTVKLRLSDVTMCPLERLPNPFTHTHVLSPQQPDQNPSSAANLLPVSAPYCPLVLDGPHGFHSTRRHGGEPKHVRLATVSRGTVNPSRGGFSVHPAFQRVTLASLVFYLKLGQGGLHNCRKLRIGISLVFANHGKVFL